MNAMFYFIVRFSTNTLFTMVILGKGAEILPGLLELSPLEITPMCEILFSLLSPWA